MWLLTPVRYVSLDEPKPDLARLPEYLWAFGFELRELVWVLYESENGRAEEGIRQVADIADKIDVLDEPLTSQLVEALNRHGWCDGSVTDGEFRCVEYDRTAKGSQGGCASVY